MISTEEIAEKLASIYVDGQTAIAKDFAERYRGKHITLRGPISLEIYKEWCKYAKSVSVVIPKVD